MSKRQRFVAISFFLALGLVFISVLGLDFRGLAALVLAVLSVLLAFAGLRRDLNGMEFLAILPLSFLLSLAFGLIFFFFPNFNIFFKLIIFVSFFASFYSYFLAANIFAAAGDKPLLLLKPAQTALIFLVLEIFFVLNTHLYKWGGFFVWQIVLAFGLASFLSFTVFYAQSLNKKLDIRLKEVRSLSFVAAISHLLVTVNLVFFPFAPFFRSLVSVAIFNAVLGIFILKLNRQLKVSAVIEYCLIPVAAFVFSYVLI